VLVYRNVRTKISLISNQIDEIVPNSVRITTTTIIIIAKPSSSHNESKFGRLAS